VPERFPSGRDVEQLTPAEIASRAAEQDRRHRSNRQRWAEATSGPPQGIASIRQEYLWLYLYCARPHCPHYAIVPLVPLIIRWGPAASIERLRRAARCTKCGHRGATVQNSNSGWPSDIDPIREPRRWTGREVWPCEISHELDDRVYGPNFDTYYHPVLGFIDCKAMCNLYSQTRSRDEIRGLFRVSDNRAYAFEPLPAIFPRTVAPIVRLAADGERELVPATWGYPLIQRGLAPKPVTNVRDDTVLTSPFWRPSFEARRCLVPASSYCEPDDQKPAGWHWFALRHQPDNQNDHQSDGQNDRPMFAFPGIWKRYKGPMKKEGEPVEVDVYAFMTTSPNALTSTIMHDRMPVLLSEPADWDTWLTGSPDAAYRLVRTYDAERMRIVQSGAEKRDLLGGPA
jgi:putative SOS response-associated peptidase YedK